MAHILFFHMPHFLYSQQECLTGKIRLSIFLIIGECAGLPAVVWALHILYLHYKVKRRVSVFIITLLLCDLLVLLLNPYIVTKLLQDEKCWERSMTCRILSSLWAASIICGIHLQQIVALEAALTLRHPHCSAHIFFPPSSISISIILFIFFFLCQLFWEVPLILFTLPLLLLVTLTSWMVTCKSPPGISDAPYRTRKPSFTVLAFVTLALISYGAFISMYITMSIPKFSMSVFVMGFSLMSLNVIIDPLLCVIISRKSTEMSLSEVNP